MKNRLRILPFLTIAAALVATACTAETASFTKQEVRAMPMTDRDYCAFYGWYEDGECDDFCPRADLDCAVDGCVVTGCSSQVCSDSDVITTCEWDPRFECYEDATCERQADGACGWTSTPDLDLCLQDPTDPPDGPPCLPTGCSAHLCADEPIDTTCEFLPEYACYADATCERQPDGECAWTETSELAACLLDPGGEGGGCMVTGCNGEVCADEVVTTTCAVLPEHACYRAHGVCAMQMDGACDWSDTPQLNECLSGL